MRPPESRNLEVPQPRRRFNLVLLVPAVDAHGPAATGATATCIDNAQHNGDLVSASAPSRNQLGEPNAQPS